MERIDAKKGEHIYDTARRVVIHVQDTGKPCEMQHNDDVVVVHPTSTAESVVDRLLLIRKSTYHKD